jgi:hypothetical protein
MKNLMQQLIQPLPRRVTGAKDFDETGNNKNGQKKLEEFGLGDLFRCHSFWDLMSKVRVL